ncbi:MAG: hypothetical protein QM764_21140 [Chitinophagaceae bacterium]
MSITKHLTLVDTICDLHAKGFTLDFSMANQGVALLCIQEKYLLSASEFEVREMHYFPDGDEGPEKMIYAVEAIHYGLKGLLMLNGRHRLSLFPDLVYQKVLDTASRMRTACYNGIL